MKYSQYLSDICNGSNYIIEDNTINLILFVDAVSYNKSGATSMWAVFSSIVELPPILRCSYENILFHSFWSGPDIKFNLFLEKYNSEIDQLIKGFDFNGLKLKVKIHVFIADGPGRAKCLNCHQHNGAYGCIFCLHPTARHKKTTVYPLLDNIYLRTHAAYVNQVNKAIEINKPVMGVKGPTYVSNWLAIPDFVILDYMHLCLIGSFKWYVNHICDSAKSKSKPYYIGL